MKKLIAIVCSMILLMVSVSGNAAGNAKYDALAVGTTDTITGNFFSEAFGANSSDLDVQTLIHGYSLVRWDSGDGAYAFDESVVSGVTAEEDAAGNRRYIIALADDLKYSNGKKITASDYAFSVLLSIMDACPYYASYTIPAGTYESFQKDTQTITVKATLICSANLSDECAYKLVSSIFENKDAITELHAKGAELDLTFATDGIAVPFHAGAAQYFAEQGITVATK